MRPDYREPQPQSVDAPLASCRRAEERAADQRQIAGRHADSLIFHNELHHVIFVDNSEDNWRTWIAIFAGVVEQIVDRLAQ